VPAGTDSTTSALGVMVGLLNSVLCEQKGDNIEEVRYCILSLLPLFDLNYFLGLASGGSFTVPPLQPVGDDPDRQSAMCVSSVCVGFVENIASSLLAKLPATPTAAAASDIIRGTVSCMRCGCTGVENPCEGTTVTTALISSSSGSQSLIESAACDTNGMITECARTWINCENVPPPQCAQPCAKGSLATVQFVIQNLDWNCLQTLLTTATMKIIRADVIANVKGLLDTDFDCDCGVATAPTTGTQCTCNVTCSTLALVKNVDLTTSFGNLTELAAALVIPTPNLDKATSTCKLVPNDFSFGSSFQVVSVKTNFPQGAQSSGASPLFWSVPVAVSLCVSLVL